MVSNVQWRTTASRHLRLHISHIYVKHICRSYGQRGIERLGEAQGRLQGSGRDGMGDGVAKRLKGLERSSSSAGRPARPRGHTEAPTVSAHASQTDVAVDLIRSRIIDLTLEPGSRIDEPLLIDTFKLGRTPAREAMNRLVAEGFVTTLPKRGGSYVRRLDLREIGEIVVAHQIAETVLGQMLRFGEPALVADLRAIQANYVAEVDRRAFLRITALNEAFHLRMHRTVNNAFVGTFAESTHHHVRRLLVLLYKLEESEPGVLDAQFHQNLQQHEDIIAAVEAGDRPALIDLLPSHARHTQTRLVRLLESKAVTPFALNVSPDLGTRSSDPGGVVAGK